MFRQLNLLWEKMSPAPHPTREMHKGHVDSSWQSVTGFGKLSCLLLQEFMSGQLCCILNTVFAGTEGSLLGMLMFCVVDLTHSFPSVLEEEAEVHSGPVVGCFS